MTRGPSPLEEALALQLTAYGLVPFETEWLFAKDLGRRFRFDFAWPAKKLAVEVEGGTYVSGRHQRPLGFKKDTEKYNLAAELGWTVLRYVGDAIKGGQAIDQIRRVYER